MKSPLLLFSWKKISADASDKANSRFQVGKRTRRNRFTSLLGLRLGHVWANCVRSQSGFFFNILIASRHHKIVVMREVGEGIKNG